MGGAGEGEEKGSSVGWRSWGSSRGLEVWGDQAVVKYSSRRCQGKVSPAELAGPGSQPFRLFSGWIGGCLILIVMTVAGR